MTLNLESFNEGSKKKSNSKYKAALGVGSVVSLFGIGSTLAANISLNGGGNVEFGQGVATTAACDEDGFTITPVTYFNNQWSVFLVDNVEVTGIDLTPEGTGWDDDDLDFASQDQAKEAYPGQYYDGTNWKRTCDNVVLDFKAYTDDVTYINKTVYDYGSESDASLQKPIGWVQDSSSGADDTGNYAPGFALVIDINDAGDDFDSNYGVEDFDSNGNVGDPDDMDWDMNSYATPSNSSFDFYVDYSGEKTDAASISKITVQSMKEFPRSYYAYDNNLGNPANWTN
jgi:hypothetical protein